jgi:N-acetylglucosaminyl-diphospho-decaprenol L-rhamnosyltransferase
VADPLGKVVTLLLNFEAAEMTLACLRRLQESTPVSPVLTNRVLLMDNGSGAEAEAALTSAAEADPSVDLRLFGSNLGYCAAMNHGLEWASAQDADYVLFLNNDVEVEDGFLDRLVSVLHNDPSLAGAAPTILRPDGRVWCQGAEIAFTPNLNRLLAEGGEPAPRDQGPRAVGYLPGACALYRMTDMIRVEGLDERYFMYFEDALLGHELTRRGRGLVWLPWIRVTHDPSSSSGGGRSPLRKYMTAANTVRFLKQHFSLKLFAAFFLFDLLGLPLAYLTGGWRAGWAKTVGIRDGLLGHRITATDVTRWRTP